MTQPVADQTPIPDRTYRRHTDPPGLWIAVASSSISLHVLLFWLLRSHGLSLLQSNSSNNAVTIEFIAISAKQTPTKTSAKRQPTAQKPPSAKLPKQVAPKISAAKSSPIEDRNAIAFTNTPQPSINEDVKPKNSKPQVAVDPEPTFQPEPELTPSPDTPQEQEPEPTSSPDTPQEQEPEPTSFPDTPQEQEPEPTSSPDTPQEPETEPTPSSSPDTEDQQPEPSSSPNPEENRDTISQKPENQENSDRAFNPQNNTTDSRNLNPPLSETNNLPDNLPKTEGEVVPGKGTPLADLAQPVESPQQSSLNTQQGGIGIGSWEIETGGVQKDIPENLAQPIGNIRQKELNISPNEEPTPGPITFQASLIIDSSGNLTDVYIPPNISEPQSSRYREYALELFKDQKFIPASTNGKKPPLSNLVVRITIVTSNQ